MKFKPKKIRSYSTKKITISIPLITSVIIIIFLTIGIVKAFSNINFNVFLKLAGEELQTDPFNHTNFLILGNAGKNHEGGNLTDSIIVASLDNENKIVTMISIPRDLYVKDELIGNSKINEVYYNAKIHFDNSTDALSYTTEKIEEIVGVPIHYYVKINFDGFKDLIEALGGIDINVENAIYDPYYPKDGTFEYEIFSISEGQHHLDGKTALKYARSRKTTSDFDRADRQQQIIYAVKEKALQTKIILNQDKIKEILDVLKSNIDTNITIKEILTLGSMASDFSSESLTHRLIHDDPTKCGGLLYTPSREFYGGAFVLIPAGGFEFLHLYSDLNFNYPLIEKEDSKIHLLNGTKTGGVAGETKQILQRFCFEINRFGNAASQDLEKTTYYYKELARPSALNFLQNIIPGEESTIIPEKYQEYLLNTDILLELGSDYVDSKKYIEDSFYYLPPTASSTDTSTELTEE